jgi:hypothetical protein
MVISFQEMCDINVEPLEDVTEPRPVGSVTTSVAGCAFGVALLRNSRKTEFGAGQFLVRLAVRAAPFALPAGRGSAYHFYVTQPVQETA